jgi:hypothetical protein
MEGVHSSETSMNLNGVTSHKHRCENLTFKKEKRDWEIRNKVGE